MPFATLLTRSLKPFQPKPLDRGTMRVFVDAVAVVVVVVVVILALMFTQ